MNKTTSEGIESTSVRPIYNKEGIFKICLAAISATFAVFTGIFFSMSFDIETMYFENASGAYILGGAVAICIAITTLISVILKAKLAPARCKCATILQYLSGITLFLLFLQSVIDNNLWLVIFSFVATAYFIGLFNKHHIVNTVLGIGACIFLATTIAQTYFDYSISVNSPYKLLCQFGIAISMLLIAGELKFDLGGGNPAMYKLVCALTFILNTSATAGSVALAISGAQNINYCFIPCVAMTIYSAKIFFARPNIPTLTNNAETIPDEKGKDTDEIVN